MMGGGAEQQSGRMGGGGAVAETGGKVGGNCSINTIGSGRFSSMATSSVSVKISVRKGEGCHKFDFLFVVRMRMTQDVI